jgi:HPt (histidine-containing phosphotransfer) domain-containing protein
MINSKHEKSIENVCDLKYLTEMMGSKKHLINEIMDAFLKQVPEELQSIKEAITKTDYAIIKSFSHTMKSSVSIMGVSMLTPILQEMEDLATKETDIEKIKELNDTLNLICKQATEEIEREKINYA